MNKRTCVITGKKFEKNELIRVVKLKTGEIIVDSMEQGRGAYIWKNAPLGDIKSKKILNRAFRKQISEETYNQLIEKIKGE